MTGRSLPARLALLAIRGYQRYLSPIKGYSCALRGATATDGCSAYGYRVVQRRGLVTGLRLLRRRLDLCALASEEGRVRASGTLYRQRGFLDVGCDAPCDASCGHDAGAAMDCLGACSPGGCDWGGRSGRLAARDTKELERMRARIEAKKRERP